MQLFGFAAGPYKTNTYVVADGGAAFVVDPGLHSSEKVMEIAEKQGLNFEAIVLTHGHLDHTREAGDIAQELNLPVYIHPEDAFMLADGSGVSEQSRMLFDAENMLPIKEVRELIDGDTLSLIGHDFELKHAPGHSPGSVLIVSNDFVLTGDVIFRGSIGRVDLEHSDPRAMRKSLEGPVSELPKAIAILPGHGPTSTMQTEWETNPFLLNPGQVS